jgi:protein-arginine kinase activator protein McsA
MDKFEQHIKRMKGLKEVYEVGTSQHNILSMLINECEEALRQPLIMVRSEQLPCSHCGRPLKEHSQESKLCPDRMKNFEQGN